MPFEDSTYPKNHKVLTAQESETDQLDNVKGQAADKRVMAEIYLQGCKTIQIPWAEADEYMAANWENLEYRHVKVGRPRAKSKQIQQ